MESVENVDKKEIIIMVNKQKKAKTQEKTGKSVEKKKKAYVN